MRDALIDEGVYRLGGLGAAIHPSPDELLRELALIIAESLSIEVVGIAVYEHGLLAPSSACYVHGPWDDRLQKRFLEQSRWNAEDRVLASRLAGREPARLYTRDELIDSRDFQSSRLYNELQRPLGVNDQALARYVAPDGTELLFGICAINHLQRIPKQTLDQTSHLGTYLARTWFRAWRREPDWMRDLKPSNREVISLALRGYDDLQIAEQLGLTYHAVRAHLKRAFRLAGVRSRLHLMQSLLIQSQDMNADDTEIAQTHLSQPTRHHQPEHERPATANGRITDTAATR